MNPAIPAEQGAEWSVLLEACSVFPSDQKLLRLRSGVASSLQWQRLFALADQHGVQPLLHKALQPVRDAVPHEELRELELSYQTNLQKVLLLSRELIRIVHHLGEANLRAMPYKGPALAESLYGDLALRQSGDIDLLVRRDEFSRVQHELAKIDYWPQTRFSEVQQSAYLKSGYECVFDGPAGRNMLEVQWAIEPRFYAVDFDMNGIFDRAVAITVAGQSMRAPSPSDLFLILAVHAAKHLWARLIWICDLGRLMSQTLMDWDWIGSQAKRLGLLRIVSVSMLLAKRLLGAKIPTDASTWFAEQEDDIQLVAWLEQQAFGNSSASVESLSYFRWMMRLRERPWDRLRFLTRLVFTPGPSEWSAIRLPASLFPMYRLVRLSRLLARTLSNPNAVARYR